MCIIYETECLFEKLDIEDYKVLDSTKKLNK